MDESTLRDSEAVLITYVRYINEGIYAEEMLFCKKKCFFLQKNVKIFKHYLNYFKNFGRFLSRYKYKIMISGT